MAIIAKGTMKQDDKTANQQQNQPVTPTVGAAPVGSAQQGVNVQAQQPQKANIQSFTSANKEGASRIGSALKTGLNRDVNVQQKQTDASIQNVRNAVEAAGKNTQLGQQFIQQVNTPTAGFQSGLPQQPSSYVAPSTGPTGAPQGTLGKATEVSGPANTRPQYQDVGFKDTVFDAKSLADDEQKAKQFAGIRTGETQAADKAAQEKALLDAQTAKDQYKQFTQKRLEQLRNNQAEGQDALLQDYLGKYMQNYTKGQSALDKSLLRLDKNNTLSQAKQDLSTRQGVDVAKAAQDIASQKQAVEANLQSSKNLQNDLQSAITQKVAEYEKLVGNDGRLAAANKYRADEIDYLTKQLDAIKNNEAVERNVVDELELALDKSLYNSLDNGIDSVYNVDRSLLTRPDDLATEQERMKAAALYKLAGLDPSAAAIKSAASRAVDPAQVIKEGGMTQANRLRAEAEKRFVEDAKLKQLTGTGMGSADWKRVDRRGPFNMFEDVAYGTEQHRGTTQEMNVDKLLNDLQMSGSNTFDNLNVDQIRGLAGASSTELVSPNFDFWQRREADAKAEQAAKENAVSDLTQQLNRYLSEQGRFDRIKIK